MSLHIGSLCLEFSLASFLPEVSPLPSKTQSCTTFLEAFPDQALWLSTFIFALGIVLPIRPSRTPDNQAQLVKWWNWWTLRDIFHVLVCTEGHGLWEGYCVDVYRCGCEEGWGIVAYSSNSSMDRVWALRGWWYSTKMMVFTDNSRSSHWWWVSNGG